jgi:hypothetical protein
MRGAAQRVRAIRARLGRLPPLALAGACWDSVAVGEAPAAGARAAAALQEASASAVGAAEAGAALAPSR